MKPLDIRAGDDYLEIFDNAHSGEEDRFIVILGSFEKTSSRRHYHVTAERGVERSAADGRPPLNGKALIWDPWEGSHALPRWCAASDARRLPTRLGGLLPLAPVSRLSSRLRDGDYLDAVRQFVGESRRSETRTTPRLPRALRVRKARKRSASFRTQASDRPRPDLFPRDCLRGASFQLELFPREYVVGHRREGRAGPREQVPLHEVGAKSDQRVALARRFHALADHVDAHLVAHA